MGRETNVSVNYPVSECNNGKLKFTRKKKGILKNGARKLKTVNKCGDDLG